MSLMQNAGVVLDSARAVWLSIFLLRLSSILIVASRVFLPFGVSASAIYSSLSITSAKFLVKATPCDKDLRIFFKFANSLNVYWSFLIRSSDETKVNVSISGIGSIIMWKQPSQTTSCFNSDGSHSITEIKR